MFSRNEGDLGCQFLLLFLYFGLHWKSTLLPFCNEWKRIFVSAAFEYFRRPILGAGKCEVADTQGGAVFRALGDTLSREQQKQTVLQLFPYIIEQNIHILTLGCHKQLTGMKKITSKIHK